jgi:pilus assembly protein FimV
LEAPVAVTNNPNELSFDMGSLSLDLDEAAAPAIAPALEEEPDAGDPLATKLSLAEEFNSIGDEDGARALAEEVLEEATGALRAKAQQFLASLS